MKWYFLIYFLSVIPFLSCSDSSRQIPSGESNVEQKTKEKNKPPSSFSDTVTIDLPAAVFYSPDSIQLQRIQTATDTMTFKSMVHDCYYQMRNARTVIQAYYPGIKIIEVKNARYLLFETARHEKNYIDLNTKNDPCGIFIFDNRQLPRPVDMTNIESELGFYFAK